MSKVKNIALAGEGEKELAWARQNMPVLAGIRKRFAKEKPFKGLRIGVALHLEKKTGVLLEALAAGGAKVTASSCNPLTTDDRVAAALAKSRSVEVYAWAGQLAREYYWCLGKVLDRRPHIIIDDGADLIFMLHNKRRAQLKEIYGACEETTTGVNRLKAMERDGKLQLPVFAINDAYSKHLFDNRFGTAQSTISAIMQATNILIAGKTIVVVGYGWCGRGIAERLKGLGANVIVVEAGGRFHGVGESGHHRGLEALYSGFRVMNMAKAAPMGDIFITATGNKNVIGAQHFPKMKDGAILANAGHFNVEIDERALRKMSRGVRTVKDNVVEYSLRAGKKLYLLSEGRLVNLARPGGQGHPIEIMDASFALQALCCEHIARNRGRLIKAVHEVPQKIDDVVAQLVLASNGILLDPPTKEQVKYAREWTVGT